VNFRKIFIFFFPYLIILSAKIKIIIEITNLYDAFLYQNEADIRGSCGKIKTKKAPEFGDFSF